MPTNLPCGTETLLLWVCIIWIVSVFLFYFIHIVVVTVDNDNILIIILLWVVYTNSNWPFIIGIWMTLSFYSFERFSHQHRLMVFHWSLSDSKFPQVSRTLLSILTNLNSLDGLHSCSYFQFFQFLYQSFGDSTKRTDYNWCHHHFHVPQFFQFPSKIQVLISLFVFLQFYSMVKPEQQNP